MMIRNTCAAEGCAGYVLVLCVYVVQDKALYVQYLNGNTNWVGCAAANTPSACVCVCVCK